MRHTLTIVIPRLLSRAFSHAQNSNDEIHMRATVQAVVPLTSFSGQVTSVDVDPRFALTVHVESVVPAVPIFLRVRLSHWPYTVRRYFSQRN
jgi:hypothetical protein